MRSKRELLASVASKPAIASLINLVDRRTRLVVLNYHRIADSVEYNDNVVSASWSQFDNQAKWLSHNCSVLSGTDLNEFVGGTRSFNMRNICMTFDDGYIDNYEAGLLLMNTYGIPAVFFITTGFVETGVIPDWDRMAFALKNSCSLEVVVPTVAQQGPWELDLSNIAHSLKRLTTDYRRMCRNDQSCLVESVEAACGASALDLQAGKPLFMNWQQIRHLIEIGHTIGAHTHSHPNMGSLSDSAQQYEIVTSKQLIRDNTGVTPTLFAYPFGKTGNFNRASKDALAENEFAGAFTFLGGSNTYGSVDRYEINRVSMDSGMMTSTFEARARTGLDF